MRSIRRFIRFKNFAASYLPKSTSLRAWPQLRNYSQSAISSTLKTWQQDGWLKKHKASREEVADLLAVADRDLQACRTPGLHNDWRFNIAYNAALQLATAALAVAGYQAERMNHHYWAIDSLAHTLE